MLFGFTVEDIFFHCTERAPADGMAANCALSLLPHIIPSHWFDQSLYVL